MDRKNRNFPNDQNIERLFDGLFDIPEIHSKKQLMEEKAKSEEVLKTLEELVAVCNKLARHYLAKGNLEKAKENRRCAMAAAGLIWGERGKYRELCRMAKRADKLFP